MFRIKQKAQAKADTELVLAGARLRRPEGRRRTRGGPGGRGLWGNSEGRFTSRGSRGAGSSRGTKWFVGDTCVELDFVKVKRGVVSFRDFVADKTITVRAGESYRPSRSASRPR